MSFGKRWNFASNTRVLGKAFFKFWFCSFDDSEPVQRILIAKPIMFREVRLNVEEKKQELQERESKKPEVVVMNAGY